MGRVRGPASLYPRCPCLSHSQQSLLQGEAGLVCIFSPWENWESCGCLVASVLQVSSSDSSLLVLPHQENFWNKPMEINQKQVRTRRRGGSVLHLTCGSSLPAMGPDNQPKDSTKRHTCGPSNVMHLSMTMTSWCLPWAAYSPFCGQLLVPSWAWPVPAPTENVQTSAVHISAINLCWLQIRFETEHAGALHSENAGEALSTKLGCGTETAQESKAAKSEVSRSFPSKGWRD